MSYKRRYLNPWIVYIIGGILVGQFILHPLSMVLYWFEFLGSDQSVVNIWPFLLIRITSSFTIPMLGMTILYMLIGAGLGLVGAMVHASLNRKNVVIDLLKSELSRDIETLVQKGESENLEFKSSVRWDWEQNKLNKQLEGSILKTLAGFMNRNGGTLLIGISDNGHILGLKYDYQTLRRKDADGFKQHLTSLISSHLGTHFCSLIHLIIQTVEEKDICRVLVTPATRPVYVKNGNREQFYLRTGNVTRELNVREALAYVQTRWE